MGGCGLSGCAWVGHVRQGLVSAEALWAEGLRCGRAARAVKSGGHGHYDDTTVRLPSPFP